MMRRRTLLRYGALGSASTLGARAFATSAVTYYAPSRYAFISDVLHHRFAVADIASGEAIGHIDLPALPKVLASSKESPYLAFSDRIAPKVWLFQQVEHAFYDVDLPSAVYKLFFLPASSLLVIALEEQIAILDYASGELTLLPGTFQSRYAHFSTIISPLSRTLTVLEEHSSVIQRWRLNHDTQWQAIAIGGDAGFAHGVPGFGDALIAFTTYARNEVILYTPPSGSIERFFLADASLLLEPYLSNDLSFAAFANLGGHLLLRRLGKDPRELTATLGFTPRHIRSGWLDQYLVIGGDERLQIRDAKTLIIIDDIALKGASVINLWISGDSKYALFTYGGASALGVYDLQKRQRRPDIPLHHMAQPNRITMNSSNNICF